MTSLFCKLLDDHDEDQSWHKVRCETFCGKRKRRSSIRQGVLVTSQSPVCMLATSQTCVWVASSKRTTLTRRLQNKYKIFRILFVSSRLRPFHFSDLHVFLKIIFVVDAHYSMHLKATMQEDYRLSWLVYLVESAPTLRRFRTMGGKGRGENRSTRRKPRFWHVNRCHI